MNTIVAKNLKQFATTKETYLMIFNEKNQSIFIKKNVQIFSIYLDPTLLL